MKRLLTLLMITFLSSCTKDFEDNPIDLPHNPPVEKNTLSFVADEVLIPVEYNEMDIEVTGNVDFSIKLNSANINWISITEDKRFLKVTVKPNSSNDDRTASVIIYNDEYKLSDTLKVTQKFNKERFALIGLYKALNGDNWTKRKNWCTDAPLSEWEGIAASGDHVMIIKIMNDAYIEGELPLCIGDFPNLISLYLTGTNVRGDIPKEIGELKKMEYLDLSNNKLSGNIPNEIGGCISLKDASFTKNNLTGSIPQNIFRIESIRFVGLGHNKFTTFTLDELPKDCMLEYIDIYNNEITTPIPDAIFNIRTLVSFNAKNNNITGIIPNTLGTTLNINIVDLSHNRLTGVLPSGISDKCLISYLDVSDNNLTGNIPDSFSKLALLTHLSLHNNEFDGRVSNDVKSNPNFSSWRIYPQNNGGVLE